LLYFNSCMHMKSVILSLDDFQEEEDEGNENNNNNNIEKLAFHCASFSSIVTPIKSHQGLSCRCWLASWKDFIFWLLRQKMSSPKKHKTSHADQNM